MVTDKWVDGWDDPRLMTLAGLRRRGVTPTAINAFVRGVGITRRYAFVQVVYWALIKINCMIYVPLLSSICLFLCYSDNSIINLDRLEYHIREELNKAAPRTMVVLHPLKVCILFWAISRIFSHSCCNLSFICFKVVITNLEADSIINLDAKRWPDAQTDDASAFYKVTVDFFISFFQG